MGIWVELGIFLLVIAFGLWQIHDVRQARELTRKKKEQERAVAGQPGEPPGPGSGSA
jgi:hypothetical protein